ncbi:MAG TPA: SdrD B-like domain-containing protein [Bacteroidota bacterium]|jgi:hypothetical protein|nr:SdrD B-like domain-containing protein [Bacteroidota bacterium]
MKRIISTLFLLISVMFWSCEQTPPTAPGNMKGVQIGGTASGELLTPTSAVFPQSVVLAGFTVTYNGRTVANNQTTFSYTVTGPVVQMAFRLELPGCAGTLASATPTNGKQSSTDPDVSPGIEWNPSTGGPFTFTVTYDGDVKQGLVLAKVKTNSTSATGFITGACARIFDIAGSVFTDGNNDGARNFSETGILGTTVNLLDAFGAPLESATSDANGNYIFHDYVAGNYIVRVDTGTVAGTQTKYLSSTTPTSYNVTIGPSSTNNNFGFAPKSDKLVSDLKFGTLPTNGLTPGFWKKQLQAAISGSGSPTVSKDSLLAYIARIRGLLLTEPYQLGTGNGLQEALNILAKPIKSDLDALNQQLLALEFNHVSNHGIISTDPSLQLTLIGWGEGLVASGTVTSAAQIVVVSATASTVTSVYDGINKSSGGGGGF